MKVLVTGSSGLLGANMVDYLAFKGCEVNALLRKTSNTTGLNDLNPHIQYGDLNNVSSIISAAKGCTWLVHCAANTKQWNTSKKEHDTINLKGTKNVIEAAEKAGVDKVAFISTANTFPLSNDITVNINTDYVESKLAAEKYVLDQQKVKAIIANPSFMIGARDAKPSSGQAILHYMNNNPVFTPAGGKSFIHVMDVAEAIFKILDLDIYGKRFLLANDNRTYMSFFKLIGEITHQNKRMITIPPFVSKLGGGIGTVYGKISGTMPKLNTINAQIINSNLYYNGADTFHKLEMQPRSIESAISEAVEWFKLNGYIR